jgi:hypothetical protein
MERNSSSGKNIRVKAKCMGAAGAVKSTFEATLTGEFCVTLNH